MTRVVWGAAAILAVGSCLAVGCVQPKPVEIVLPRNESLRFSGQPIPVREQFSIAKSEPTELQSATRQFQEHLRQLEKYAGEVRLGKENGALPDIFSEQFETSFLERNRLQSAFLEDRIRIARWRLDEQTPTYYDSISVEKLFQTLLEPWNESRNFRIELTLTTVNNRPNYFEAEVLADIFGTVQAEQLSAAGGQQEFGRSATGVWQIVWTKGQPNEPLKIKKINLVGHEETVNYVEGGTLFRDYAGSVLRDHDVLRQNLAIGLDAWARRFPGMNPIGCNGLAVGDVNGDGLDDVYLCQPEGLENLLLIQNPDGTADSLAAKAGVDFRDETVSALIADLDNDRDQDLAVVTDTCLALFSNNSKGEFELEHEFKFGIGCETLSAVDFDRDGDLDLYLSKFRPVSRFDDIFAQPNAKMNAVNGGRNILLRNDEAWEFKDITTEIGLESSNHHYSRAAAWMDMDHDGYQDLYVANEFQDDSCYENRGNWFSEIHKRELSEFAGNSTTVSCGDFNHDGRTDIFVAADSSTAARQIVHDYISHGGKLLREAEGFAAPNRILMWENRSLKQFLLRPPVFSSDSSFSSVVADFNNDSWEDIGVTNGWLTRWKQDSADSDFYQHLFDAAKDDLPAATQEFVMQHEISDRCRQGESFNGQQRNKMFLGLGPLRFANYSSASGIDLPDDSRAIAATDWDGDGDVDLLVNNRTAPRLRILINELESANRFVKFRLLGTKSNRDAIGSRIEVHLRGIAVPLVKTLTASSGRVSQSSKEIHFGLGSGTSIEQVVVLWPNGDSQTFANIGTNKTYRLVEGTDEPAELTDERYRIALDSKSIAPSVDAPAGGHIRFFPTSRLPILQFRQVEKNKRAKWYQIENIDRRPLLCVFCPRDFDNQSLLKDLAARNRIVVKLKGDLLVVYTDNHDDSDNELRKELRQIAEAEFPFRWGVLSQSSNAKLAQLFGQWFFDQSMPKQPFAILLDGEGNVHFGYDYGTIKWDAIEPDLQDLADKTYTLNKLPDRVAENWLQRKRTPRFDRLKSRFDEMGYQRDASYLEPLLSQQYSDDYMYRAVDLAAKGNLVAASSAADRSVELNPNSIEALITSAEVSRQFALSSDQQAKIRLLLHAGKLLDKALLMEPDNVQAILSRVEVFRLQKDLENAISLLEQFVKAHPENWLAHARLGRLYFYKKDYYQATKHLITAIENRPTLPYVAADLGYLYLLKGQFIDAKEFLELGTRLQPSDDNLKRYRAEAEFWTGNLHAAAELFEQTAASSAAPAHARKMLALLKASSPFAEFRNGQTALDIIDPFVTLHGNQSPSCLEIKAACLAELEQFEQARDVQRQAIVAVEDKLTLENYSDRQLRAMKDRLELYKRNRVFRIGDVADIPLLPLGQY
jgi:tetratricopeptide (TPR) repeat protein